MSKIVDQPERYFLFYPYIHLKMTPCAWHYAAEPVGFGEDGLSPWNFNLGVVSIKLQFKYDMI